jgi:hypothetical protein
MTVTGGRVVYELRGVSCLPLKLLEPTRKEIAVTRSFGNPVTMGPEICKLFRFHASHSYLPETTRPTAFPRQFLQFPGHLPLPVTHRFRSAQVVLGHNVQDHYEVGSTTDPWPSIRA